jgi:hemerythrin-like metal-binding protein
MAFIEFTDKEKVNVKEIDEQHVEFVRILNAIYEKKDSDEEELKQLMKELESHIKEHFKTELDLMIKYNDPGYISHKLEHERMELKVIKNVRNFLEGKSGIDPVFIEDLRRWFFNHLEFNDRKLAKHILKNTKK